MLNHRIIQDTSKWNSGFFFFFFFGVEKIQIVNLYNYNLAWKSGNFSEESVAKVSHVSLEFWLQEG